MSTTIMYDSVDPRAIPGGAKAVAGYLDPEGWYHDWAELTQYFAGRPVVSITSSGVVGARVGDCEPGAMSVAAVSQWAAVEIQAGRRPTVYCSRSAWDNVRRGIVAAGIHRDGVDYWIADWTGEAHLLPGTVATQYASPSTGSGGDYDLSVAEDVWLAPSFFPPGTPPLPTPPKEGEMTSVVVTENGTTTVLIYAASPEGHLLEFSRQPGNNAFNSVIDITAGIGSSPTSGPYLVAP